MTSQGLGKGRKVGQSDRNIALLVEIFLPKCESVAKATTSQGETGPLLPPRGRPAKPRSSSPAPSQRRGTGQCTDTAEPSGQARRQPRGARVRGSRCALPQQAMQRVPGPHHSLPWIPGLPDTLSCFLTPQNRHRANRSFQGCPTGPSGEGQPKH